MKQQILVPLDGSNLGETVLPYAVVVARQQGWGITLLHVVDPVPSHWTPGYSHESVQSYLEMSYGWARGYLQAVRNRLLSEGIPIEITLTEHHAAEAILAHASQPEVRMVAMSTHGRSGIRRWIFGSVTEQVVRSLTAPLLIARAGIPADLCSGAWPSRIMIGLDGSTNADQALGLAQEIARPADATLVLVSVMPSVDDLVVPPEERAIGQLEHELREEHGHLSAYLKRQCNKLRSAGVKAQTRLVRDYPAEGLLHTSAEEHADLIVLTTHGRSGIRRFLLGSIALKIVQAARLPVLLVRTQSTDR